MDNRAENEHDEFLLWYVEMIEKFPDTFVHYLSEDALLKWFGRSFIGPDKILYFTKTTMLDIKHANFQNFTRKEDLPRSSELGRITSRPFFPQSQLMSTPESKVSSVNLEIFETDYLAGGDGPNILKYKNEQPRNSKDHVITLFETVGTIEFCRSCDKMSTKDKKWSRSCTLKIKYTGSLANTLEFRINSIIYGDKMLCKKNLLAEFEECIEEDK